MGSNTPVVLANAPLIPQIFNLCKRQHLPQPVREELLPERYHQVFLHEIVAYIVEQLYFHTLKPVPESPQKLYSQFSNNFQKCPK
ncbi:MAG: hypothetical protein O4750_04485 [Trichodesmium sp. St18_bin3_1_1]|nr:hypothetical protein [Trichodesmium sp. St18_bin3_1_1]